MQCNLVQPGDCLHNGPRRAIRGGSWNGNARNVRAAYRSRNEPDNRWNNLGFRCAGAHARTGWFGPEQTVIRVVHKEPQNPMPPGVRVAGSSENSPGGSLYPAMKTPGISGQ